MIPKNAANWRVTLKLKANARCRIEGNCLVETDGITAEIQRRSDGTLGGIVLSCSTQKEHLPILSAGQIHEPDDPNRNKLLDAALRFEGMLGPFGMVEIEFSNWEWSWHYSALGSNEPILYFSYSNNSEEFPSRLEPIGIDLLAKLTEISLSSQSASVALTLSLARDAENHFHNYRYIDAIRSYYLAIEHECAQGKTGKTETLKKFRHSEALKSAHHIAGNVIKDDISKGNLSIETANILFFHVSFEDLVEWLYLTRGSLFHQKSKKYLGEKWNPSHNIPHKHNAIVFRAMGMSMTHHLVSDLIQEGL